VHDLPPFCGRSSIGYVENAVVGSGILGPGMQVSVHWITPKWRWRLYFADLDRHRSPTDLSSASFRIRLLETFVMRSITILAAVAILAGGLAGPAFSQGAPQTVALVKVDPQSVATGFRSSKVVGASVVNETNETVGAIDDLIVTPNERVPYAILSVGGFLGMGTKYVVVPFSSLQMQDKKIVLPGATKDALKALPEYKYNS
jgi:hypothetical protein